MIKEHDVEQGSADWFAARCGVLTASAFGLIITPTLKVAANEKERTHLYDLLAQRITGFVEPAYESFDMRRGHFEEVLAREAYAAEFGEVRQCGFITNDRRGYTLGYSPDGLVGRDGQIEAKSHNQKLHLKYLFEHAALGKCDPDHLLQVQGGLLVSERQWCDYISYCGGLPMVVIRCHADPVVQEAIAHACDAFEDRLRERRDEYLALVTKVGGVPTERITYDEEIEA